MTYDQFAKDPRTVDAVLRNLEIIGEAVKNLPAEFVEQKPEIEWKQLARFRDLVAHYYFNIKLTIVWDVLGNELAALESAVESILTTLPDLND